MYIGETEGNVDTKKQQAQSHIVYLWHVPHLSCIYEIITVPISVTLLVRINVRCKFGALHGCMHGSIAHTGLQAWLELHHPLIVHQTTAIHLHRNNNTFDVKPFVSTIIDTLSTTLDVQLHSYSIVTNHGNPSVAQSFSQWEDDQTKTPECINSE